MNIAPANTLDEVISGLDAVIAHARLHDSRLGYFPCLYKKVTIAVKEGIERGEFDDGPRMERLDVVFANRYLAAAHEWLAGRNCSKSWTVAFDAAQQKRMIALQHLLLGMNAHINLDLSVAAAQTAPGQSIYDLKGDFYRINLVLSVLIDQVQEELGRVSPLISILDVVAGKVDEQVARQGIRMTRNLAWQHAVKLALQPEKAQAKEIVALDKRVASVAKKIARPGIAARTAIRIASLTEPNSPSEVIYKLDTLPMHRMSLTLPHDWEQDMADD